MKFTLRHRLRAINQQTPNQPTFGSGTYIINGTGYMSINGVNIAVIVEKEKLHSFEGVVYGKLEIEE